MPGRRPGWIGEDFVRARISLTIRIGVLVHFTNAEELSAQRRQAVAAETGSKAGIQPETCKPAPEESCPLLECGPPARSNMNAPGYALHPLKGELEGQLGGAGQRELAGLHLRSRARTPLLVDYKDYH